MHKLVVVQEHQYYPSNFSWASLFPFAFSFIDRIENFSLEEEGEEEEHTTCVSYLCRIEGSTNNNAYNEKWIYPICYSLLVLLQVRSLKYIEWNYHFFKVILKSFTWKNSNNVPNNWMYAGADTAGSFK